MDLRIIYLQNDYAVMYCNNELVLEGDPQEWTLELILKQLSNNSKIVNYTMEMEEYTSTLNYKMPDKFADVESLLELKLDFTMDSLKDFSKTQNLVKILKDKVWQEI